MTTAAMKFAAAQFKGRIKYGKEVKPGSNAYRDRQAEFFTGVMAGWVALLGDTPTSHPDYSKALPPMWVFGLMQGHDIVKETEALPD